MARFDNYEFRCSALGKIISKSGKLTDGIKTYLQDVFIGEIYGVRKEAFGKALDKGVFCEEDGITMLGNTLLKGQLVIKNKERKRNGFIHGECDVFKDGIVFDIKNALTLFTFGKAELSWDYDWQLVGYSWLWEANRAILYYCLNNMPEALLQEEKMSLFYKNRWKFSTLESEDFLKACDELEAAHNYDNMPIHEKFKFWEVDISEKKIETLKTAVIEARKYLNQLWDEHCEMIQKNLSSINEPLHITIANRDNGLNITLLEPETINLSKLQKLK